jgi:UDP-glucose 4-epimerase
MKACVFGGAGYIGSHMVRALIRAGHDVLVFDNLSTGHRESLGGVPLMEADILDVASLDRALGGWRPDVVFHFAALSIVADSVRDPSRYHRNNVDGSARLIDAMHRHGLQRMVFSSSAAVYGATVSGAIHESQTLMPINPYGESKRRVEALLAQAAATEGLRSVSLRYFNAAGADPGGDIGEAHEPETHLIPNALRAVDGGAPLQMFGDDYPTRDGTCVRDYVHVNDLADAHLRAAEFLLQNEGAFQFNLGSGRGFTVREVVDAVERVTGRRVPHHIGPRREGDPAALIADTSLATRELNWVPAMSDVDSMVETAWRWHLHRRY